jgi:hypothetical protein
VCERIAINAMQALAIILVAVLCYGFFYRSKYREKNNDRYELARGSVRKFSIDGPIDEPSPVTGKIFHLAVRGKAWVLDEQTVDKMNSDFMRRLLDPDSGFAIPADHIYRVDADPECFACILHLVRFGILPSNSGGYQQLMTEAGFWGVVDVVQNAIEGAAAERGRLLQQKLRSNRWHFDVAVQNAMSAAAKKLHHNRREDDGHGRVYCTDCGNRDIDSRFYAAGGLFSKFASNYTTCKNCKKMVLYDPQLNWCHKCSLCKKCQASSCPNDYNCNSRDHICRPASTSTDAADHFEEFVKIASKL